jgi:hypothetical protein
MLCSLALVARRRGSSDRTRVHHRPVTTAIVPLEINSQVTSRTSPNLIDTLIALATGAAGAYANVDRRVSA